MDNDKYEEIVKKGERTSWYGVEVPKDLITASVTFWSDRLKMEIDKLESEKNELKGSELEKRNGYLKSLYYNLQNAPYSLNGDFYLKKKKRFEKELEEESKKEKNKTIKKTKKTTKEVDKVSKTKNSDLIFGKNKK